MKSRHQFIPYNPKLKKLAQELRKNSTWAEIKLWSLLKPRPIKDYKFIRQKPLLNYIVDFYCKDLMLVIEIDGASHDEKKYSYDSKRQKELEDKGISFLRFSEFDVMNNTDNVMQSIENWILENE